MDESRDGTGRWEAVLDTGMKRDIARFFATNPDAIDSLDGLRLRLGVAGEELKASLEELVSAGVLRKAGSGPITVFRLAPGAGLSSVFGAGA